MVGKRIWLKCIVGIILKTKVSTKISYNLPTKKKEEKKKAHSMKVSKFIVESEINDFLYEVKSCPFGQFLYKIES